MRALGQPDRTSLEIPLGFGGIRSPVLTTTAAIVLLALVQAAIFALTSLLDAVRSITQQLLQDKTTLAVQRMVMEQAASLDLSFFEDSASYDLLRRAREDTATRPVMLVSGVFGLIQTTIVFASMITLLVALGPVLALIGLVSPIPAFVAGTRYGWLGYSLSRWAAPLQRRMQYLMALVTTDTYAKEVKLFGLGRYFVGRFGLIAGAYYGRERRFITARYLAGFLWGSITTIAGGLTYLYVALLAVAGRLTLGDVGLYTQAAASVQNSIRGILGDLSGMYEHNLYLSNLFELLATPGRIRSSINPRPLPRPLRGEVEFQHVWFRYPSLDVFAVRDLSFRVAAGETIAVVGRNGAGKTTVIKLLCRLYDPTRGRILLDGIDIRELDVDELRGAIAGMFQDYVAYQATAAENVGLGNLDDLDDRARIEAAARKGGAHHLIAGLRRGYDTPLGTWFDHGAQLSGGEWQRVALSRAFMRDARLLVLDEPTSTLDAQAEYELFERLRRLTEGRTAIYISHRFSTVRRADRIVVIERGRAVEEGSHEVLMALAGRYSRLFDMQASAYTGKAVKLWP